MLTPVEPGVVDTDRGACGELHGQCPVALPEGLASLRPRELREPDHCVVGDHRHGERRADRTAVGTRNRLHLAGAQREGARRVEGVAVHGAQRRCAFGAGQRDVGHGAREGDPAQLAAAVEAALRGFVAGQQPLVQVHRRQVAEAGHRDVEQFAGGGLQVEGVPDAGARLVQQGEVAPGIGRLARRHVPAGDIGAQTRDAERTPRSTVDPVEVDRPMPAVLGPGRRADQLKFGDRLTGLQDPLERCGHPVGLGAGQIVVDGTAAVLIPVVAEESGEAPVDPLHREVRTEQQEAEGRLAEYGL